MPAPAKEEFTKYTSLIEIGPFDSKLDRIRLKLEKLRNGYAPIAEGEHKVYTIPNPPAKRIQKIHDNIKNFRRPETREKFGDKYGEVEATEVVLDYSTHGCEQYIEKNPGLAFRTFRNPNKMFLDLGMKEITTRKEYARIRYILENPRGNAIQVLETNHGTHFAVILKKNKPKQSIDFPIKLNLGWKLENQCATIGCQKRKRAGGICRSCIDNKDDGFIIKVRKEGDGWKLENQCATVGCQNLKQRGGGRCQSCYDKDNAIIIKVRKEGDGWKLENQCATVGCQNLKQRGGGICRSCYDKDNAIIIKFRKEGGGWKLEDQCVTVGCQNLKQRAGGLCRSCYDKDNGFIIKFRKEGDGWKLENQCVTVGCQKSKRAGGLCRSCAKLTM